MLCIFKKEEIKYNFRSISLYNFVIDSLKIPWETLSYVPKDFFLYFIIQWKFISLVKCSNSSKANVFATTTRKKHINYENHILQARRASASYGWEELSFQKEEILSEVGKQFQPAVIFPLRNVC